MRKYIVWISLSVAIVALVIAGAVLFSYMKPPASFPARDVFQVKSGDTVTQIAQNLSDDHIITETGLFKIILRSFGGDKSVAPGFYLFDTPQNALKVAWRLANKDFNLTFVKITVPEGSNRFTVADIVTAKMPGITRDDFLVQTKNLEGHLFPDTYLLLPFATTKDVVNMMTDNYEKKVAPLRIQFTLFGKSEKDIVTMASILEGEARLTETRKIIAGILWNRIAIGMPLQVDVSFIYINGKTTKDLTRADLAIKSPYNTYINKGLPPTPISNPGIDAILAAVTPTKSDYLYFLTDANGVNHYAATFAEHVANKQKYLK